MLRSRLFALVKELQGLVVLHEILGTRSLPEKVWVVHELEISPTEVRCVLWLDSLIYIHMFFN
jgi:hypothetical protein